METVDGQLYGVNIGTNSQFVPDKTLLDQLGLTLIPTSGLGDFLDFQGSNQKHQMESMDLSTTGKRFVRHLASSKKCPLP